MSTSSFCKKCGCSKHECECSERENQELETSKKVYSQAFEDKVKRAEEKISRQVGKPVKLGDRKYSASIILAMMDDE